MAATLDSTIRAIFECHSNQRSFRRFRRRSSSSLPAGTMKYMEIPISSETFELPMLAFAGLGNMYNKGINADMLVTPLRMTNMASSYKSLEAMIKDTLATSFRKGELYEIHVANSGFYYGTFGALFNHELRPLMMLSWVMQRRTGDNERTLYCYKRPILRLDPDICVSKADPVERLLSGKMVTSALNAPITPSYGIRGTDYTADEFRVKVEIDECPFTIKETDTPSISVTNEALLQLASNHIEEMLQ